MEPSHRFLPQRKNRGNRMSELAKDEGKMLEDEKYEIFKEDPNDDDFNPDDLKKSEFNSSSDLENEEEEGEEGENEEEESDEEESKEIKKKEKKEKKKEEEILDIDQLDIDKIDMLEDLRDKGIDIDMDDEEEIEKRMREYNEESEYEEEEKISKKKVGRKKKEMKKKGRKKLEKIDDNIFLDNPIQETNDNLNENKPEESDNIKNNAEFLNGKIIISNPEFEENNINNNEMELEEENQSQKEPGSHFNILLKPKKEKKEKTKIKININTETDDAKYYNPNVTIDDKFNININKSCLTELLFPANHPNLEYIELNKNSENMMDFGKTRKSKLRKPDNKNIISINYHTIVINKRIDKEFMPKEENKNKNNKIINDDEDEINTNIKSNENNIISNELLGHKRTRYVNNLIDLFKKQKKAKLNKNVTIVGNRENPKYIYISKKIYDENDGEKELIKEEKKKKKKEKDKTKDEDKDIENETISFDLEQEADTKNIIKKYKQQERDKKQFGIQNKVISQEQRLLESIFTELTNKQSLKTMQKLEDLNKREYTSTSKKVLKDSIKIINSQRHIIEETKEKEKEKTVSNIENKNNNIIDDSNKKQIIEIKITDIKKDEMKFEEKKNKENLDKSNENEEKGMVIEEKKKDEKDQKQEDLVKEEKDKEKEIKERKEKEKEEENKKLIEEYKQREKKLNKITVTFTNKEYFRSLFANMNKKPIKDKKEKICIITGKPAKYFDPLTKNYYATVEAFKILRERYFQKEEDCLLFKIQTLSDLASQKKERLKKMIMQESEKPTGQTEFGIDGNSSNNFGINKKNNAIRIDSETMTVEEQDGPGNKMGINSTLLKMINKFGLLRKDAGNDEKKVISHRIYNRNRENCVESGMLLEANKYKLIISKKIFKDKYSSKLPTTNETNNNESSNIININNDKEK